MSPEELDKARVKEARRLWNEQTEEAKALPRTPQPIEIAARLARENWTPPDPISPRVMAAREWLKGNHTAGVAPTIDRGEYDRNFEVSAFLAGFAAAVKLAEPVVEAAAPLTKGAGRRIVGVLSQALTTYRQSIGDGE